MLSHVLLGTPAAASPLLARLGPNAIAFFTAAQRLCWGIHLPEFVHTDVLRATRRLTSDFPELFVAHLLAAFAARAQGRSEDAEQALERARALAAPGDPLGYLLPTPEEWQGAAPEQRLVEVVPDQVWRIAAHFPAPHTPLLWNSVATVVRSADGQLFIINPVATSPAVRAALEQLGRVSVCATATVPHHCFVEGVRAAFPEARHFGVSGHARHPPSRHLRFDGCLVSGQALCPELDLVVLDGFDFTEGMFLHRPSGLLIGQDLATPNYPGEREVPFAMRLYAFCFGVHDRMGLLSYQPMLYKDLRRLRAALREVLAWRFESVVTAHCRCEPYRGAPVLEYRALLEWLAQLTSAEHTRLLWRFARHQPGILWDFLRYDLSQRRASGRA